MKLTQDLEKDVFEPIITDCGYSGPDEMSERLRGELSRVQSREEKGSMLPRLGGSTEAGEATIRALMS